MLRRHVWILVVRIAVARHATNLGREMWLLLGALAVMRLRRCIASHRRCYVTLALNSGPLSGSYCVEEVVVRKSVYHTAGYPCTLKAALDKSLDVS